MHLVFAYNMPHQIPSGELIYSFAALLLSVHPRPRPPKMLIFGPRRYPHAQVVLASHSQGYSLTVARELLCKNLKPKQSQPLPA